MSYLTNTPNIAICNFLCKSCGVECSFNFLHRVPYIINNEAFFYCLWFMKNDRNATNLFRKVSLEQDKDLMVQEGDWVDSQYIRHRHLFDKLQQPLHRSGQGMELYCHPDQQSWVETITLWVCLVQYKLLLWQLKGECMMICGVDPIINLVLMIRMTLLFLKNHLTWQQGMEKRVAVPTIFQSAALRLEFTPHHEMLLHLLGQQVMQAMIQSGNVVLALF